MFYLKINDKLRKLINLITDLRFGCRDYCKYQLIALDEFEMLRIELANQKLKILTNDEINEIKNSTEKIYFHTTHVCIHDNKEANGFLKDEPSKEKGDEDFSDLESIMKTGGLKERKRPDVIAKFRVTYDFSEKTEDDKLFSKEVKLKEMSENTFSYGISMIGSFFLLVLGSYYFGKDYLGWSPANTLKLTLVVTIIVFFAEAFLLIIKLSKNEDYSTKTASENIKKYSLAYQLNPKYRNSFFNSTNKRKVYDSNVDNKEKKD